MGIELDLSTIIGLSDWAVTYPEVSMACWEFEDEASYSTEIPVSLVSNTEACREAVGTVRGRDFATGLKRRPPFSDILLIYT